MRKGGTSNDLISLFSKSRRQVGLTAVLDEHGILHDDVDSASEAICRYWSKQLSGKTTSDKLMDRILDKFSVPFPETNWVISYEEFLENISSKRNSSPGPDGIPYSFYQKIPPEATRNLYKCYTN